MRILLNTLTQFCLLLIVCNPAYALEELEKIQNLKPVGLDQRNVGWQWHYIDQDGKPGSMTKTAESDTTASYTRTDGCQWTRAVNGFAPATVWSNCPSTGKATVTFTSGTIWPLKVGNQFSYKMRGSSSFLSIGWEGKRDCRIPYSVRIDIVSGEYDTFKIICEERWGVRTWWVSPEVGTAVAYQHKTSKKLVRQEMTKIVY